MLISIRKYGPLIENVNKDLGTVLDALLIFLLQLSIRMRLDRLDGVGEYVWADIWAVKGTVSGFFKGLRMQVNAGFVPIEIIDGFKAYLSSFKHADLLDWSTSIVDQMHPDTFPAGGPRHPNHGCGHLPLSPDGKVPRMRESLPGERD